MRASLDLWEFCRDQAKPFIYASSAATYGDGTAGFDDDGSPEGLARLRPLNGYAWSKHLVDRTIARRVTRGAPLPPQWVGLKFFNVYGPNEYHKESMRSVAKQLHEQAHATGRLRLFKSTRPDLADGGQRRDFIYVRDCAEVVLWLLDHPKVSGLFNLGTGQARSFLDLAEAVRKALPARKLEIEFFDMPAGIERPLSESHRGEDGSPARRRLHQAFHHPGGGDGRLPPELSGSTGSLSLGMARRGRFVAGHSGQQEDLHHGKHSGSG